MIEKFITKVERGQENGKVPVEVGDKVIASALSVIASSLCPCADLYSEIIATYDPIVFAGYDIETIFALSPTAGIVAFGLRTDDEATSGYYCGGEGESTPFYEVPLDEQIQVDACHVLIAGHAADLNCPAEGGECAPPAPAP